jgi:membrane protein required for colicin V production
MHINWHDVNWFDYGIIGLISISVLMGIIRGFIREALSLVTWLVAIFLGVMYCQNLGDHFTSISIVGVRLIIAFIIILLTTLIVGGITAQLVSKAISLTGFGVTDRIVGTFFGFARGAAVVAFGILFIQSSPIIKLPMYQSSEMVPKFQPISHWMQEKIPEDFLQKMKVF